MTVKTMRKVVKINEELCNGCGVCITSCAEGALKIIDGKAKLVSEKYCDGLGNCLKCPQDAITIEEREAEGFDEVATQAHLEPKVEAAPHGCPGSAVRQFQNPALRAVPVTEKPAAVTANASRLTHWPVQMALVQPGAPFLKGADLVLAAHCVPFADANFHQEFLGENKALLIACPKLDDFEAHQQKLNRIFKESGIKSITVVHMEVPCCSGLVHMVKQAMLETGNIIPFNDVTISVRGEKKG
jgi:NAD-dependent dihydropyrimidine dehydrogenase PreA subunit